MGHLPVTAPRTPSSAKESHRMDRTDSVPPIKFPIDVPRRNVPPTKSRIDTAKLIFRAHRRRENPGSRRVGNSSEFPQPDPPQGFRSSDRKNIYHGTEIDDPFAGLTAFVHKRVDLPPLLDEEARKFHEYGLCQVARLPIKKATSSASLFT